jgi:UDP-N-acetylmuramyl pentapeptide phosphotransferase/UDP-N-acetylglucosamine-1-phosphate transferase
MIIYFVSCILSYILTWLAIQLAIRKSVLDIPNNRSSHTVPTPRGGGIAISITWFFALIILYSQNKINGSLFYGLLCGIPIAAAGLVDDLFSISPKIRILIQSISAIGALYFLKGIDSIGIGYNIIHAPVIFNIIAFVGIIWFTNLFNFLDGIDGYLSAEIVYIGLAFFLFFGSTPPLVLSFAALGFLIWNWQPAKIFMGDVGSTLLGFTISVFAVYYQNEGKSSVFIWLMLTSVFWFDATLTLYRRWRNKEHLSLGHRKHAYQRIVQSGFSHRKTVLYSIAINITILALVWIALKYPSLLLPVFFVNIVYLYILVRLIDKRFRFK